MGNQSKVEELYLSISSFMLSPCCSAEVPQSFILEHQDRLLNELNLETIAKKFQQIMKDYERYAILTWNSPEEQALYETYKIKSRVEINILDYVTRIQKYTKFANPIFVGALLLLERAAKAKPELKHGQCAHKLFIGCITLASKTTDDDDYYMSDLAKIYGIDMKILQKLESVLFLEVLNCKVHITEKEYSEYLEQML